MKLTKEECNYAYTMIDNHRCYVECEKCNYKDTCNLCRSRNIIKQLINEHFDNKPLKFEELHEGMWVWDNKTKSYIFVFKPLNWEPIKGLRYAHQIINHSAEGYYMDFEENRFYRKEVK